MKPTKKFKKFIQLFRMEISKDRYVVISKTIDNTIAMTQQIEVVNFSGEKELLFLKNAFIFKSIETFNQFREDLYKLNVENEKQLKLF